MKFRKKPVVIEAEQFRTDGPLPFRDRGPVLIFDGDQGRWYVMTLEGPLTVSPDDWIICGVKGEFYPCKPDIFAATYESVEGATTGQPQAPEKKKKQVIRDGEA